MLFKKVGIESMTDWPIHGMRVVYVWIGYIRQYLIALSKVELIGCFVIDIPACTVEKAQNCASSIVYTMGYLLSYDLSLSAHMVDSSLSDASLLCL